MLFVLRAPEVTGELILSLKWVIPVLSAWNYQSCSVNKIVLSQGFPLNTMVTCDLSFLLISVKVESKYLGIYSNFSFHISFNICLSIFNSCK